VLAIAAQRIGIAGLVIYVLVTSTLQTVIALQSNDTRNQIIDCTEPTGECYKESQEHLRTFLKELVDSSALNHSLTRHISVVAAACAADEAIANLAPAARVDAVEACVNATLKREGKSNAE